MCTSFIYILLALSISVPVMLKDIAYYLLVHREPHNLHLEVDFGWISSYLDTRIIETKGI